MTDQQRAILTAIIAQPHATIHEIKRSISHGKHSFLTQKQIKYAMQTFGITRERYKGRSYVFNVPEWVVEKVAIMPEPVIATKVDKVWTKPMTKAPHMQMFYLHGNRMSLA